MAGARRRWRGVLLAVGAGLTGALIAIGCALTCRPTWYEPASIDYARLKADKRELVGLADEIGAALNGRRSIDLELYEDQINRWITARAEIWPDSQTSLEPLRRPQITLLGGNADNRLYVYDSDIAANDVAANMVGSLIPSAVETVTTNGSIQVKNGAYIALSGTNPQAIVDVGYGGAYGSNAVLVDYGRRR